MTDDKIMNYEDFSRALQGVLKDKSLSIENLETEAFLEALSAWLDDTDGGEAFFESPGHEGMISWSDLYKLIKAAAIYE